MFMLLKMQEAHLFSHSRESKCKCNTFLLLNNHKCTTTILLHKRTRKVEKMKMHQQKECVTFEFSTRQPTTV